MPAPQPRPALGRRLLLGGLAALYVVAGVLHLAMPAPFLSITPGWVPYPAAVIALTGVFEIAAGIGLIYPATRRIAGLALAAYAVCVFPANITHAMQDLGSGGGLGWWYHAPRLALQPVLVWAAIYCSGWLRPG